MLMVIGSGAYISCNKQYSIAPLSSTPIVPTATVTSVCGTFSQLGNMAAGPVSSLADGSLIVTRYQFTQPALVYSLSLYLQQASGSTHIFGIYGDNSGFPGSLIVESAPQTDQNGWNTAAFYPVNLAPGYYWLALGIPPSDRAWIYGDFGLALTYQLLSTYPGGNFPATYPTSNIFSNYFDGSIYANYCPLAAYTFTPTVTGTLPTSTFTSTPTYTYTPTMTFTHSATFTHTPTLTYTPASVATCNFGGVYPSPTFVPAPGPYGGFLTALNLGSIGFSASQSWYVQGDITTSGSSQYFYFNFNPTLNPSALELILDCYYSGTQNFEVALYNSTYNLITPTSSLTTPPNPISAYLVGPGNYYVQVTSISGTGSFNLIFP
jgi:hypothetical protein